MAERILSLSFDQLVSISYKLLLDMCTKKKDIENTDDEACKKIIRCPKKANVDDHLDQSFPLFGPFYGNDQQAVLGTKKKAWQHVKRNWSSSSDSDVGSAKEIFAAAIRRVEKEAKETYGEKITGRTNSEFRLMMVKDGCFFLQLALLILGKSSDLGYSKNDPIFGSKLKKKDIRKWIESMFYVGNQIPLVVLKELMKQKFFQELQEDIFDEDDDDLEANINIEDGDQERLFVNDDNKEKFPSATELKRADIVIKKQKGSTGIRRIRFQSYYVRAYLYLPVLPVDDYMEILFRNLKTYEISCQKDRQVSSYLRLMSDIIQTPQDARLLKKQGIIEGSDDDAEKLPRILSRLSNYDADRVTLPHEFHILKRQIRDYSSPWVHYRGVLNVVVYLTLVQSFFAVLAYFKPPKQH
ncbi:hypothetical protein ACJIZ3_013699 [Penstemon smallii]|uniref:Uncharacterized protein n=1 Tax=Penstemon smallii TaxID=265156 RepID=A0ABD3RKY0_9LAMI